MKQCSKINEKGMLTVEAILSLVPFILVILGIISFINIFIVHNKIQYALYESANELTAYTYFYQAIGLRDADKIFNNDRDTAEKPVRDEIGHITKLMAEMNAMKDDYNAISDDIGDLNLQGIQDDLESMYEHSQGSQAAGSAAIEGGKELLQDPMKLVAAFAYWAAGSLEDMAKNWLLEVISSAMVENYLDATGIKNASLLSKPQDADAFLKAYGVKNGMNGLDFSASKLFVDDDLKMIDIVVQYDVEVYFFKLFLKDPTIHVVQRVEVPAWLDGDGEKGHYNTR